MTAETFLRALYAPWRGNLRELRNSLEASVDRWKANGKTDQSVLWSYIPHLDDSPMLHDAQAVFGLERWLFFVRIPEARKWADERGLSLSDNVKIVPLIHPEIDDSVYQMQHDSGVELPLLSISEALYVLCLLTEDPICAPMCFPIHKDLRLNGITLPISLRLRRFDEYRDFLLPFPPEMDRVYNCDGSRKVEKPEADAEAGPPDLTGYSEDGLLREYYNQLHRKRDGVKIRIAEDAGIGKDAASGRLKKFL